MRSLRWFTLFVAILLPGLVHGATSPIGVISEASGEVRVLRAENYFAAAKGVEIEAQDILETGAGASLQVELEDGSTLRLGPDTRLALSEYRLDERKNVIAAGIDLLTGWLRFAVAKLKSPDENSFRIHAPTLTVGIRGTEGVIEAAAGDGGVHLERGEVVVEGAGEAGTRPAPVRLAAGEFVQRAHGRPFERLRAPPPAFQRRLPPMVQRQIVRRALAARERGVPPRMIRAMTREDARRYLERHPHAAERLRRNFRRHGGPDGAGAPLRQRPAQQEGQPVRPGAGALTPEERQRVREAREQRAGEWRERRAQRERERPGADGSPRERPERYR